MDGGLVDGGQREIGESFLIGPIGYGCWRLVTSSIAEATTVVDTAVDCGMNLIDVADVYGVDHGGAGFGATEEMLGRVIASSPTLRQRLVIATKAGIVPGVPYDSSSGHLRDACDASLQRLGIETIDLFQLHRPDLFTHPGEIADALVTLKEQGKIQEVGVSNHTPAQIMALQAHLPIEIVTTQPEYSAANLTALRDGTLDQAMELGLTTLAWSPLGGGRIGDGAGGGVRPELIATLDRLAEREGTERSAIALAFVLCHPASPVPLIGTQQPERIKAAVAALHVHLDRADLYAIVEASEGVPLS
ncbi:MAG: aldo/keto reductase family oxidoreductase [Acidimicrobiia bacterium]